MLFFDLETTGLDPERDRIVELAAVDAVAVEIHVEIFDPGIPIPPGASAVHGITDADVRGAPRFRERAPWVQELFQGRRLCGYNCRSFDTPLLHAALRRAGQPGLELDEVREIDLLRVWKAVEPAERVGTTSGARRSRSLSAAVERYLGRELTEAHRAVGDTRVLVDLLTAMREAHDLSLERMMELSSPSDEVDRAGKLRREAGELVFAFGRHRGEPVTDHPDYVDWMLGADFPADTKAVLRRMRREGAW